MFNSLRLKKLMIAGATAFLSLSLSAQTDVYDYIQGEPNLDYLQAAIDKAQLQGALSNTGETYTVFAPTNAAFDAFAQSLGQPDGPALVTATSQADLSDILLYHVISGRINANAVQTGVQTPLNSINTVKLTKKVSGDVFANHAQVVDADNNAPNGVVHVVDNVLQSSETVVDAAINTPNQFNSLVTALIRANLLNALSNPSSNLTVFAPTDAAFISLRDDLGFTNVEEVFALSNLADILTYHVLGTEVASSAVTNGAIVQPLSQTNTLKLTKKMADGSIFVNQAPVIIPDVDGGNGVIHAINEVVLPNETVVDVAIDVANEFDVLVQAVVKAELLPALTDPHADLTVFAPTDAAFQDLADDLELSAVGDLLDLDNLGDILTYHVLGSRAPSSAVTNGLILSPLSETNTLKFTRKASNDMIFVNQAEVSTRDAANLTDGNGIVHIIDAVVLPNETVVDVAIDAVDEFNVLVDAVVKAELLPALTDPSSDLTVFAPTDAAFADLANDLEFLSVSSLLDLDNLGDILTYHVLGSRAPSSAVTNGLILTPLNESNTLKFTRKASNDMIFVNQAEVVTRDVAILTEGNGVVHVINSVVLPDETVVDIALDADDEFNSLVAALVKAELLPSLLDPNSELTVFAPTDLAFENLAEALNTDIDGILERDDLAAILTYHVLAQEVLEGDLTEGLSAASLQGQELEFSLVGGATVNGINIIDTDNESDNGVVHIIDGVLIPETTTGLFGDFNQEALNVYPNPVQSQLFITDDSAGDYLIFDSLGNIVKSGSVNSTGILVEGLEEGVYYIRLGEGDDSKIARVVKL